MALVSIKSLSFDIFEICNGKALGVRKKPSTSNESIAGTTVRFPPAAAKS